jgi:D-alanyl-D-alanine carboxypeptidase/D-alanyl-D-alanine-endopeptidase (penicillin-binding protein 4)
LHRATLMPPRLLPLLALLAGGVLGTPPAANAQTLPGPLQKKVAAWYRTAARYAPGRWGVAIANQDGEMLWSVKPDELLIPASTVKLLTTGFARTVLGGEAKVATRVKGAGHLDEATGEWIGSWSLELNGDYSLEREDRTGPSLNELAQQLAEGGVRKLWGPLQVTSAVGPADAVYPAAWSRHHWGRRFAPLVGPITLNENMVWLTVRPGGRVGAKPSLIGTAPSGLDNLVSMHARTVGGFRSRLAVRRMADGGFLVTGTIGAHSAPRRLISVSSDPRAVLVQTWALSLRSAGIEWDQSPAPEAAEDSVKPETLAEVNSATLDSLAKEVNTRSLNIGAELLLQWAGGRDRAPELLTRHVEEISGVVGGVHLSDGSGLSHEDRVTPATFVSYLARFPQTAAGKNFPMLLPANGQGTLARLRSGLPAPGVVHAKTGTLGNVSTLVGYLGRRDGVFLISLMYNGGRVKTAKKQQWKLFRLLGADGVTIPDDSFSSEESDQLGGDDAAPADSTR